MILAGSGKRPHVDETAFVAPTAVLSGDVTVGAGSAVLHGAVLVSEGAPIVLGESCVVMEHAVLRASAKAVHVGDRSLIAPHAYVVDVSLPADAHVPIAAVMGENPKTRNAETYAAFLRKTHADDALLDDARTAAKKHPPVPEEIPKAPHVEGVDNAMMLELAEMEHRRQESLRKQRGPR